jgi:hypothetical protein
MYYKTIYKTKVKDGFMCKLPPNLTRADEGMVF